MAKTEALLLMAVFALFSMIQYSMAWKIGGKIDVVVILSSVPKEKRADYLDVFRKNFEDASIDYTPRIGFMENTNFPKLWDLNEYEKAKDEVMKNEPKPVYFGEIFESIRHKVFDSGVGRVKVVVLFAPQQLPSNRSAVAEAEHLRRMGVFIYAGIDKNVPNLQHEIEAFTGSPSRVFSASGHDFNDAFPLAVIRDLCGWKSMCRFWTTDLCMADVWQEPAPGYSNNLLCNYFKPTTSCERWQCEKFCNLNWPWEGLEATDGGSQCYASKIFKRANHSPSDPTLSSKLLYCPTELNCLYGDFLLPPAAIAVIVLGFVIPIIASIILLFCNKNEDSEDDRPRDRARVNSERDAEDPRSRARKQANSSARASTSQQANEGYRAPTVSKRNTSQANASAKSNPDSDPASNTAQS